MSESIFSSFLLRLRANGKQDDEADFYKKKIIFPDEIYIILVGMLTSKIAVLGDQKTHTWFYSSQGIHYE